MKNEVVSWYNNTQCRNTEGHIVNLQCL